MVGLCILFSLACGALAFVLTRLALNAYIDHLNMIERIAKRVQQLETKGEE